MISRKLVAKFVESNTLYSQTQALSELPPINNLKTEAAAAYG